MKKQILILGLSFMTTVVFANEAKTKEKKEAQEPVTKCCTMSATTGSGKNSVTISVTRCSTSTSGNVHIAAAHACSAAQASADSALALVKDMTFSATNNN